MTSSYSNCYVYRRLTLVFSEIHTGFRLRRSVKLIPGIRLNFSTRGASISLGSPGTTLNFSGRGARATFGIPGTGFSWSQSLHSGGTTRTHIPRDTNQSATPINTLEELENTLTNPNSTVVYRSFGRRLSDQMRTVTYLWILSPTRSRRMWRDALCNREGVPQTMEERRPNV